MGGTSWQPQTTWFFSMVRDQGQLQVVATPGDLVHFDLEEIVQADAGRACSFQGTVADGLPENVMLVVENCGRLERMLTREIGWPAWDCWT
jgi:hypothetical protein